MMKTNLLFCAGLCAWTLVSGAADGKNNTDVQIYRDSTKAPRLTGVVPVALRVAQGNVPQMAVKSELAKLRVASEKTSDTHFGRARRNVVRKFPRVTLSSIKRAYASLTVETAFRFSEGASEQNESATVTDLTTGRLVVIDFNGIEDVVGTDVDSSFVGLTTIRHTKTKYFASDLLRLSVKVTDPDGIVLYDGTWEAPNQTKADRDR